MNTVTETPRVPTAPDQFGEWQFVEPLYAGLRRILERDLGTARTLLPIYVGQRDDGCSIPPDKPVPVLIAEDFATAPPYLVLDWQYADFNYEGARKLPQVHYFFLDSFVGNDRAECGVLTGIRLLTAQLRVLLHAKPADYWLHESPRVGIDASLKIVRASKLIPGVAENTRGAVQRFRVAFTVTLTEMSSRV